MIKIKGKNRQFPTFGDIYSRVPKRDPRGSMRQYETIRNNNEKRKRNFAAHRTLIRTKPCYRSYLTAPSRRKMILHPSMCGGDVYLYTSHATICNDRRLRRYVTALSQLRHTFLDAPWRTTLNLISLITENCSDALFVIIIQSKFPRLTNNTFRFLLSAISGEAQSTLKRCLDVKSGINIIQIKNMSRE